MEKQVSATAQTEIKKESVNLPYHFTNAELIVLGKQLAEKQNELGTIDKDSKSVAAQWKSKLTQKQAEINVLSIDVSRGYDYRDIPCEITLNDPVNKKTCRRLDTGEVVWVQDLTDYERQRTLEFVEKANEVADSEATEALPEAAENVAAKPADQTCGDTDIPQ